MANFKVHFAGAALGSGALSTLALGSGLAQAEEIVLLAVLGTVGGLLPDIDLDHSSPSKMMFTGLALVFAFIVLFSKAASYSLLELWIAWGFIYIAIRYALWEMFGRFTVHRGIFHSLVAALFFWFLVTTLAYYLFDLGQVLAWLCGLFVFLGYLIHLGLDEFYSVDFIGKRLKASFGTALKVYSYKDWQTSALMAGAMVLFWLMTPDAGPFLEQLGSGETWGRLGRSLWPQGMWFEL